MCFLLSFVYMYVCACLCVCVCVCVVCVCVCVYEREKGLNYSSDKSISHFLILGTIKFHLTLFLSITVDVQSLLFSASASPFLRLEHNDSISAIQEIRKTFYALVYLETASQCPCPVPRGGLLCFQSHRA